MWTVFRSYLAVAALAAAGGLACVEASAETIALIGTGNVGSALGRRFAEHGHRIVAPAEAASRSDIVVLAVPWSAAEQDRAHCIHRRAPLCCPWAARHRHAIS
jgi:lactate dehydrogenase-like 2-hydroxyacid dehydrogenase